MNALERAARSHATHVYQRLVPAQLRASLRHRLILNPVTRRLYDDYAELDAIDRALRGQAAASTIGMTERVVEIPWVIARYRGERRVLDVGPAYALPLYLEALRRLRIPELHGVDLSPRQIPGMAVTQADVRAMPFADHSFDLVLCVSTLEHIGRDNEHYGVDATGDVESGDLAALTELRRVLSDAGRILITVPFGQLDVMSWQKQYDLKAWTNLIQRAGLQAVETEYFRYGALGWGRAGSPDELAGQRYRNDGAPGATGVLCAVLRR